MSASSKTKLRVGLVGAGMVGQLHARAIKEVEGMELSAIADLRPELRGIVAGHFSIPKQYATHHDLLEDADIDLVWVVTRRDATSAVVRDCLQMGKPVFSEKPMAMTGKAAMELADIARRKDLFYMVGFQKRSDPGTAICKEALTKLLESKELGRLTLVRVWNHTGQDREQDGSLLMTQEPRPGDLTIDRPAPDWLPDQWHGSYDRFVNAYCHDVNALHHFFAEEPQVRGADLDIMGGQAVTLAYPSFVVSMALTLSELTDWSMRGEWDEGLEFHFEGGRLLIAFPPPLYRSRTARVVLRRGSSPAEILNDGASHESVFTMQARSLLRDFRSGVNNPSSGIFCANDMELIEGIWSCAVGATTPDNKTGKRC